MAQNGHAPVLKSGSALANRSLLPAFFLRFSTAIAVSFIHSIRSFD